ncbi:MAG: hypothetical protein B6230_00820 [Desulfobacteraceae bacterium 4572_89]|nr:MAG: hypothetical protein B6230_00820 [Desulfobacteraceae bacterium 4572_89]
MKNDSEDREKMNLRIEARTEGQPNSSVEFNPGNSIMAYQFKIRDFSSKGLCIMVRKDSKVLQYIKTGDILDMKYYPADAMAKPVKHQTQIKHISDPEPGKHQGHVLVGLLMLE